MEALNGWIWLEKYQKRFTIASNISENQKNEFGFFMERNKRSERFQSS